MSDPYLAEIRMFAGNFAPYGWALCNGQLLPLSQNTALFSLLGTTYGGDGKTSFALPNLQDTTPMMWGAGPGLANYEIGETGGTPTVTLVEAEMAAHPHLTYGTAEAGDTNKPPGQLAGQVAGSLVYAPLQAPNAIPMNPAILQAQGGGGPHNNRQPYLAVSFIIALAGTFPARG